MNKCIFCDKNNMLKKSLLYKGKYWKVYLANNQDYIGRLIITTNKHIASLDNCDENYLLELFIIIKNFKNKLSKKLGIEHFNYSYLMNSFTKYDKSLWHVHIHMIPRTSKILKINNTIYQDKEFGKHYIPNKNIIICKGDREYLIKLLK